MTQDEQQNTIKSIKTGQINTDHVWGGGSLVQHDTCLWYIAAVSEYFPEIRDTP